MTVSPHFGTKKIQNAILPVSAPHVNLLSRIFFKVAVSDFFCPFRHNNESCISKLEHIVRRCVVFFTLIKDVELLGTSESQLVEMYSITNYE